MSSHQPTDDAPVIRPHVDAVLPSSVRTPESRRFEMSDIIPGPDDDDADLDFLTALASEVDAAAPANAAPAPAILRGANPRIDDMQVFREMKDEGNKTFRYNHQVADVEMGDLLEELNTVRAALRRQKAA